MTTSQGSGAAPGPAVQEAAAATAERVLELVRAAAPGAEAEVTAWTGAAALTRFANSFIHQNVAEEIGRVALRVALDGHVASATLDGRPSDEALGRLVTDTLEAARVRPIDPDWPGLAPPAAALDVDHWDEATAAARPDERARRVADFVAAAEGLPTAGFCSTRHHAVAFANSAGQRLAGRSTAAVVDGIARTPSADGSARAASVSLAALDGRAIGARAAAKARAASEPTDLEPGRYEVVLEPNCVANILTFLAVYGFNARAVEEGRSFVRLGEAQFDRALAIRDDAADPGQVGIGFDAEGTPKRRVELVSGGITRGVLHTRRTAAKAGTESTGSLLPGAETFGAIPANVVVEPGDRTADALVAAMERGLLVTDLHYTRILDPRTMVVTGLTRNGVWLVEEGRLVRPVKNLRFTQSYLDALGPGAVRGISRERALIPDDWGDEAAALVPTLHLASWNFTGGARG